MPCSAYFLLLTATAIVLALLLVCGCCTSASTTSATTTTASSSRPNWRDKAATARWMVHTIDYGVLSTISSRFVVEDAESTSNSNNNNAMMGVPFGNVYSFVDGKNASGTPYFYGTYMDQSLSDMQHNAAASLTLTEASLLSKSPSDDTAMRQACSIHGPGDPENPVCARLTLTGTLTEVPPESREFATIRANLLERHPQMNDWPIDHDWVIVKLVLQHIWLIDYYGGATVLDPTTYYNAAFAAASA
jgi:hypothetical protein